jgi:hypothetical protein
LALILFRAIDVDALTRGRCGTGIVAVGVVDRKMGVLRAEGLVGRQPVGHHHDVRGQFPVEGFCDGLPAVGRYDLRHPLAPALGGHQH